MALYNGGFYPLVIIESLISRYSSLFYFASAQIATKKCNCTHTLKFYLTMRVGPKWSTNLIAIMGSVMGFLYYCHRSHYGNESSTNHGAGRVRKARSWHNIESTILFFTNTCFFKKADINAHSGRFDKLFVSTQHAPFPFFERNKIRHFFSSQLDY